jgi:TatD DNase family protein
MTLYDCHCHLADEAFDADRAEVIERAREVGVRRVLSVSEDLRDAHRVLEVCERHADFMVPALGVHPDRVAEVTDAELAEMEDLIRAEAPRLGGIGEVGLDYRPCWDDRVRERQVEVFRWMIRLGSELGLPLSVHSRSAGRHAIALLDEERAGPACAPRSKRPLRALKRHWFASRCWARRTP